jgi:hypothetical protein
MISVENLEAVAALAPAEENKGSGNAVFSSSKLFDVEGLLKEKSIGYSGPLDYQGGKKWLLDTCPFNPEHVHGEAAVFQLADGKLGFKCQHNSCKGKGWSAFRDHYDPGRRERVRESAPPPTDADAPRSGQQKAQEAVPRA